MNAAAAVLDELVARGVRHVVLSPGSRSQALALVAAQLEHEQRVHLHVRIDERVAGFLALGLARESGVPAAVIVTSGTAVANLMPAVLEAHHSGVGMIVLSGDRPAELRGVGANQTTKQPEFFGEFVRWSQDAPAPTSADDAEEQVFRSLAQQAYEAARGVRPGPAHLNLPFREPLAGSLPSWWGTRSDDRVVPDSVPDENPAVDVLSPARTVVVAGADAGTAAEALAYDFSLPLIAEIVSGARFGPNAVAAYRELLADPDLGQRVERVLVVGHPTLTREVTALLQRPDVDVRAVASGAESLNLNGTTTQHTLHSLRAIMPTGDREWLRAWQRASRAHTTDVSAVAPDAEGLTSADRAERRHALAVETSVLQQPVDRSMLVDAVWRATWPHDRLVFGSSRLVRVADRILTGKNLRVHANRGLAGIDGTIATATGVALARADAGAAGVTRVLVGDLTFLHDVGALLHPEAEASPRLQIVVGNDGGGTIFDTLEVADRASASAFDRVQYTPHAVQLSQLAAAYGWTYVRAQTRGDLERALLNTAEARTIIEVPLSR